MNILMLHFVLTNNVLLNLRIIVGLCVLFTVGDQAESLCAFVSFWFINGK